MQCAVHADGSEMSLRLATFLFALLAVVAASPLAVSHNALFKEVLGAVEFTPDELAELAELDIRAIGNANTYIDLMLRMLKRKLPERVDVPDPGTMFNLKTCYMFGLDQGLKRSGDATMITIDNTAKFTASIKSSKLGVTCKWHYMLLGGDAAGTTDVIDISMGLHLKMASGSSPELTEFRVMEVADIETDISGLTFLFNWILEDIVDVIVNSYKTDMVLVIEVMVKGLLQDMLDHIVIP